MSDLKLVRTLTLKHPADDGTTRVEVHDLVGGDTDSRVPILLQFLDDTGQISATVALRWSEWDEVRDHVEYCATMMKPEPTDEIAAVGTTLPWTVCGAINPNRGGTARELLQFRCILTADHSRAVMHVDAVGQQTWPVEQ